MQNCINFFEVPPFNVPDPPPVSWKPVLWEPFVESAGKQASDLKWRSGNHFVSWELFEILAQSDQSGLKWRSTDSETFLAIVSEFERTWGNEGFWSFPVPS